MYLWRIKACPLETGSRSTSPILIELKDLRFNCGRKIKEKDLPKGFGGGGGKRCLHLIICHVMTLQESTEWDFPSGRCAWVSSYYMSPGYSPMCQVLRRASLRVTEVRPGSDDWTDSFDHP